MKKLLFCALVLLLFSCKTLETHIENIDNYEPLEMAVPNNALVVFGKSGIRIQSETLDRDFQKKTLVMGEYSLVETGEIAVYVNVPPKGESGTYRSSVGGNYRFYKGESCLRQFDIVTDWEHKAQGALTGKGALLRRNAPGDSCFAGISSLFHAFFSIRPLFAPVQAPKNRKTAQIFPKRTIALAER